MPAATPPPAAGQPPATSHWRLFALLLRGRRGQAAALALVLAVSSALPLAGPQLLRAFIDSAAAGRPIAALALLAGAYVGVAIATQAVSVAATYAATRLAWTATNQLRATLARHLLRMDLGFHGAHPPGELIERADGDVTALSTFLSSFVPRVAGGVLMLAGVLVAVSFEEWRVGLALTLFAGVVALTIARQRDAAVALAEADRAAVAGLYGQIEERLAGAEDLRANAGGPHAVQRFHGAAAEVARAGTRSEMATIRIYNLTTGVFVLGGALSLAAGVYLHLAGAVSLGTVFLLFQYTELLRRPIEQIVDELQRVQEAAAGITRIHQLLDVRPSVPDRGVAELGPGPLAVELDRVTFAYDDGVPVLDKLSLRLEPGTVLGVVGRTGSGKTTLARLLLRLIDPVDGAVRVGAAPGAAAGASAGAAMGAMGHAGPGAAGAGVGAMASAGAGAMAGAGARAGGRRAGEGSRGRGASRSLHGYDLHDLRDLRLDEVRARIGLVTQDVQLFKASVRDNLTLFGAHAATDEQLTGLLDRLGLGRWLRALPEGLDTELGPGGAGTSAGEAQLLAFARIFLRGPGLIILDEAASRLDPASEAGIERAIDLLLEGRTAILIAHRLKTVDRADEILVLDRGAAVEHGPRAVLAADPGSRLSALLAAGLGDPKPPLGEVEAVDAAEGGPPAGPTAEPLTEASGEPPTGQPSAEPSAQPPAEQPSAEPSAGPAGSGTGLWATVGAGAGGAGGPRAGNGGGDHRDGGHRDGEQRAGGRRDGGRRDGGRRAGDPAGAARVSREGGA